MAQDANAAAQADAATTQTADATPASDDKPAATTANSKKALVDRIVAVIEQASTKGVSKHKIVKFLKNQSEITQEDINLGYQRYYEKHHLYEITFNEDKMGFSVIMDPHGKNAIVSSIQNPENEKVGLKIASRIVEIHGTNVEGWQHRKILDKIQQQKTRPFFIVFREPEVSAKLQKLKQKEKHIHSFLTEDQLDDLNDSSEEFYSSGSDDISDDDSKDNTQQLDPDVAAVKQHTERKLRAKNKNLVTVANMDDAQWKDDEVAEMEARLREMMEANNITSQDAQVAKGLSHKRRETLMSLLDKVDDNSSNSGSSLSAYPLRLPNNRSMSSLSVSSQGYGHYSQYSIDSHQQKVHLMNTIAQEHPDWTVDQIRQMANSMQEQVKQNNQYLAEQTKGAGSTAAFIQSVPQGWGANGTNGGTSGGNGVGGPTGGGAPNGTGGQMMANGMMKPVTPSTRAMMSMWSQPQNQSIGPMGVNSQAPNQQMQNNNNNAPQMKVASRDLLEQMRKGTVFFKRTTKGKLVPRWVEFSTDFQKLIWYSPRKGKNMKATTVSLARIQKIHVGKQSSVTLQDKSTAFTLEYLDRNDQIATLTLVAESQQQAFLWFQAIKMCGDASKRGNAMNTAESSAKLAKMVAEKNPNANRSVVLDLPGSDSKPPTVNDLEKLLKRANDLYKKVLPLIQGKKGIVMKSLKKKYPQRPVGALDPNVPRNQKSAEALEYEDIHNSIENVKKEMVDKYGKNLSDYRYLLDKLMVEDDEDVDQTRDSQLRELKISLFLMINELVSLKVKLVAIARRFQSSGL